MNSHFAIDNGLLNEALQLSGLDSEEAVVAAALLEFVNSRKQLNIIELFGKFDPDPGYDCKKARKGCL
jgi:hypothetical protein